MKVKEIEAKSIIQKTNLPEGDFVINPYIGCAHGCKFCYARFMKRFTGHKEPWGEFVDVKVNAPDLIPENTDKYRGKSIAIGSVTDPYQPLERKHKLTRRILKRLIPLHPRLDLMTKSDLVLRDIDLLQQFKLPRCEVAISLSGLDDSVRKELEPRASSVKDRLAALGKLHRAGVKTVLFISPILPGLTDWKELIERAGDSVDEFWFENLNLYPSIRGNIYDFLGRFRPELLGEYKKIYSRGSSYWFDEEEKIRDFCRNHSLSFRIYFHH